MKKHNYRKILAAIALAVCTSNSAHADAVIVNDPMHMAQTIAGWAAEAEYWGNQLSQMQKQFDQLQSTYNNMTGSRGFSNVLNSATIKQARRMLPQTAESLLNGSYGDFAKSIDSIKHETSTLDSSAFSSSHAADQWNEDLNKAANNKALSMEAYNSAKQRLDNLESLISQISSTNDQKAIMELQARIGAEQGLIQNEMAKIQSMSMLVAADKQISEIQARDVSIRTSGIGQEIPRVIVEP